ncbi:UNVERIFIED_CONTAM: hypothetical protein RMT77_010655 [Armadillidium vulgare]
MDNLDNESGNSTPPSDTFSFRSILDEESSILVGAIFAFFIIITVVVVLKYHYSHKKRFLHGNDIIKIPSPPLMSSSDPFHSSCTSGVFSSKYGSVEGKDSLGSFASNSGSISLPENNHSIAKGHLQRKRSNSF